MFKDEKLPVPVRRGGQVYAKREEERTFSLKQQRIFLEHFAATCDIRKSAEIAGVSLSAIYKRRTNDPAFQAGWEIAQDQGYASLEAALVQRALETASNTVPDETAMEANYRISFKDALQLLQTQGRARGKKPGEQLPRRSDLAEATTRLEKILKGLKIEPVTESGADREGASGE